MSGILVHSTSIRMTAHTRGVLNEVLDYFSKDPDLVNLKMVNVFRLALYALSYMSEAELQHVDRTVQIQGKAIDGTPLRIPGKFYQERVLPLVGKFSNAVTRKNGVNVSQLTIKGVHFFHQRLIENNAEFSNLIREIKGKQFKDNYDLC